MTEEQNADLVGTELASEVLLDGRHVLLAFLARGQDGGEALELGTWSVTEEGKLVRRCPSLLFPLRDVDRVRGLAERAVESLLHRTCGEDEAAVLERDSEFEAIATRGPDGMVWASLAWPASGGLAAVPAAEIGSFVRVLAEAERELAELGLVDLPIPSQE